MRLKEKVIIVTGSTTGIGKAIAIKAVSEGAKVVIHGLEEDLGIQFVSELGDENAACLLIQAALPHLIESRGSVLNIGSINAWGGEHNLLAYSISKGALMTMTRNLGDSLFREKGVRVNQINPGWVLTENEVARKRTHGLSDDWHENLPKVYAPAGRLIYAEEIAVAAMYWLSDESGPISGQVVDLEQYPMIGRNVPKDANTIPHK